MIETRIKSIVGAAVDASLGWGTTEVTELQRIPGRTRARCICIGPAARALELRRSGYGPAFQRTTVVARLVVQIDAAPDDVATSTIEQCRGWMAEQSALHARAACAGLAGPLAREEFLDLDRLRIDVAAAQELSSALGTDTAVREWLRVQLAQVFDHRQPAPSLEAFRFTVAPVFRLSPLALVDEGGFNPREGRWIGNQVDVGLAPGAGPTVAARELKRALAGTRLAPRPVVHLEPSPSAEMIRKVREHPSPKIRRLLPSDDLVTWRATMEERPIRVAEAFG